MATSPVVAENVIVPAPATARSPLVPLLIAMVLAVLLSVAVVGGIGLYLVRSGRVPLRADTSDEIKSAGSMAVLTTHTMVLEPMVANLADAGGAAYLKLSLTLRIADEPVKKDAPSQKEKGTKGNSDAEAAVRDTVLMVLGRQTAEALLAPEGKQRLKSELRAAFLEHNPELKVVDLFFSDFLVQR